MVKNQDILLSIENLSVQYITRELGVCRAVNDFSLEIARGETVGLVGETGAGKTTVAKSIMGILPVPPAKIAEGSIKFEGENLLTLTSSGIKKIRGSKIAMIFQDPMTALNPIDTVGDQIAESIKLHMNVNRKGAREMAIRMMEIVGIPGERYGEYPHQFSGGMKQRIVIAMALSCNPSLLLADEPTTALDVTVQAQVLELINNLKNKYHTSVLMITHDLGIVAEMCDKVAIMYAGEIVEWGSVRDIYKDYRHPYTKGLFDSLPGNASNTCRLKPISGLMPNPADLPPNCKFEPRCMMKCKKCTENPPEMLEVGEGHWVRCHLVGRKE